MEQLSETPTTPDPVDRPARLWNRNFVLLWQGQMISQLGNQAFAIAMMFWLMRATGSASLMGAIMFASMLPGVVLGPFGGTFADRHSRIRIVLVSDLLSGTAVLALAFALFDPRAEALEPAAVRFIIGLMFVVAVLQGILRSFFTPAIGAAIPDLVPKEKIPAANSLNQFAVQASSLFGQAIGGVLYQVLGAAVLFAIDGASFLYAGICAAFIRPPARQAPPKTATDRPFRQFMDETREGFRYLWRHAGIRDFTIIASLVNFLGSPILVLFPFYVELYLKEDAQWYGFLVAAIGAGSIAGFVMAGTIRLTGESRRWAIFSSMLLAPFFFGILGFIRNPYAALAVVFLGGAALGIINVYLMSMIQVTTPDEVRGRVLGLLVWLAAGLMPLGMLLGGLVGDLTGKNVPLIFAVCGGTALVVSFILGARRDLREFLTHG
jgi:MFS transporter, DHA3 family, macrolide efflux protein